jgi:hypothetical protein
VVVDDTSEVGEDDVEEVVVETEVVIDGGGVAGDVVDVVSVDDTVGEGVVVIKPVTIVGGNVEPP